MTLGNHLSDETLLRDIDGELPTSEQVEVKKHRDACWSCRARRLELEQAISNFVHAHRTSFESGFPPADGPRAMLKARLAELHQEPAHSGGLWLLKAWGTVSCAVLVLSLLGLVLFRSGLSGHSAIVVLPDSRLTPGATVLADRLAVCAQPDTNNKPVSAELRRRVFEEYGMKSADPAAYEVDYLVTPALGGADDIHNLWPHSSTATGWNARIKDELEDRLRDMVCDGSLDLTSAQQEIAGNWIVAYKKYFHTDRPLDRYCRKCAP